MVKRALLRGRIALRHPKSRTTAILKSLVATPAKATFTRPLGDFNALIDY